jgi:hypothetical protein
MHAWRRRDDVVAAPISGRRCEARHRGDRAVGASAKPATTAQLPTAAAIAMGAAPCAGAYARASITHGPLLRRHLRLPVNATRAGGGVLHMQATEQSLGGSCVDPPKSGHLQNEPEIDQARHSHDAWRRLDRGHGPQCAAAFGSVIGYRTLPPAATHHPGNLDFEKKPAPRLRSQADTKSQLERWVPQMIRGFACSANLTEI